MTTIWACASPDATTYHDTETQATTTARAINTNNRTKYAHRRDEPDVAFAYPVTVDPEVRGEAYWNRRPEENAA